MPSDQYYSTSPLLFWTILSVGARRYHQPDIRLVDSLSGPVTRLVWSTLADIPQSYHVVKALCLLCTWPFPTSSTSTDPTFMLCGMMMQVAMQFGLHRPSHAQDFTKFRVELIESELRDRVRTWAICNTVAQRYVKSCLAMERGTKSIIEWPRAMDSRPRRSTTGPCPVANLGTPTLNFHSISKPGWTLRNCAIGLPRRSIIIAVTQLGWPAIPSDPR